jgi:hypothetical protein
MLYLERGGCGLFLSALFVRVLSKAADFGAHHLTQRRRPMDDFRKIGIGLSTAGILFQLLGVLLFFDKGLLAMGNVRPTLANAPHPPPSVAAPQPRPRDAYRRPQILFLAGVVLIIGFAKTYRFFFQKRKAKGSACFFGGILLVLWGWPIVGMSIEGWGFLNLFGDFFPVALGVMRNMPIIGNVLSWGPVRAVSAPAPCARHGRHGHAPHASPRPARLHIPRSTPHCGTRR